MWLWRVSFVCGCGVSLAVTVAVDYRPCLRRPPQSQRTEASRLVTLVMLTSVMIGIPASVLFAQQARTEQKDLDVADVMNTWTLLMGFPLVSVVRDFQGDLRVTQKRFLINPDAEDPAVFTSPYGQVVNLTVSLERNSYKFVLAYLLTPLPPPPTLSVLLLPPFPRTFSLRITGKLLV